MTTYGKIQEKKKCLDFAKCPHLVIAYKEDQFEGFRNTVKQIIDPRSYKWTNNA